MEGSTERFFPFSHGLWENQGTVAGGFLGKACDRWHGFFSLTDDVRMSKRGPMAQESRNLNRELCTSRNAWLYGSAWIFTLWWTNIAMENHHAFKGNIHYKWPFSIAMLVHQRVSNFIGSFLAICFFFFFNQVCFPLTGSFEISVLVFRNWTVEHSGPMIFRIQKSNFLLEACISQHFTIIFPSNDLFPHQMNHFPWKKSRLCSVFRVTPSLLAHWPGRPGVGQIRIYHDLTMKHCEFREMLFLTCDTLLWRLQSWTNRTKWGHCSLLCLMMGR